MRIFDAAFLFFGLIAGMIIMSGFYVNKIDEYKSLTEEYSYNSNRCTELLNELQNLAHRQQDFIQELTH